MRNFTKESQDESDYPQDKYNDSNKINEIEKSPVKQNFCGGFVDAIENLNNVQAPVLPKYKLVKSPSAYDGIVK